jgi:hypothetical protein
MIASSDRTGRMAADLQQTSERHCAIGAEVLARVVGRLDEIHHPKATDQEKRA